MPGNKEKENENTIRDGLSPNSSSRPSTAAVDALIEATGGERDSQQFNGPTWRIMTVDNVTNFQMSLMVSFGLLLWSLVIDLIAYPLFCVFTKKTIDDLTLARFGIIAELMSMALCTLVLFCLASCGALKYLSDESSRFAKKMTFPILLILYHVINLIVSFVEDRYMMNHPQHRHLSHDFFGSKLIGLGVSIIVGLIAVLVKLDDYLGDKLHRSYEKRKEKVSECIGVGTSFYNRGGCFPQRYCCLWQGNKVQPLNDERHDLERINDETTTPLITSVDPGGCYI